MSQQINNVYVDEVYSQIFIENLRPESFLVDGVTYTSKYAKGDPKGGVVWFHKLKKSSKGAEAVGQDYSATEQENDLVPVYLTNAFRDSKKLRGVTLAQITAPYLDQTVSEQAKDIRVGKDITAIACLVEKGTADSNSDAVTEENVISVMIGMRKQLRSNLAKPNVMLISPDVHASLLTAQITKQIFTPETNDELIRAGSVGRYLGMVVFERPELGDSANTAIKYIDSTTHTVDISKSDIVMYQADYFGVVNSFEEARVVPSERFAGSLANVEQNAGFGVMDAKAVLVHKHA